MEADFECPRCGNSHFIKVDSYEDGSQEVECYGCNATIQVRYSISIEVEDVEVSEVTSIDFECPECCDSMTLDSIDEESGSEDYDCDNCEAILEVEWSDWGEYVNVEVVEKPEKVGAGESEKNGERYYYPHDDNDGDMDDDEIDDNDEDMNDDDIDDFEELF